MIVAGSRVAGFLSPSSEARAAAFGFGRALLELEFESGFSFLFSSGAKLSVEGVSGSALAAGVVALAVVSEATAGGGFGVTVAGVGSEDTIGAGTRDLGRKKIDAAEITRAPISNPAPTSDHHLFRSCAPPA